MLVLLLSSLSVTQTFFAKIGAEELSHKTGKQITLSSIDIGLFSGVNIKGVFVEDVSSDTLLMAGNISIDANLFSIAFGELAPSSVQLDDVIVKIKVDADSIFNFNYLIDAFTNNEIDEETVIEEPLKENEPSEFNLDLNNVDVSLNNVNFVFYSETAGLDLEVMSKELNLTTDSLNIADLYFSTKQIYLSDARVDLDIFKETESVGNEDADTTSMPEIFLQAERLDFDNVSFYFNSVPYEMNMFSTVENGFIIPKIIDINNMQFFAKDAKLANANVGIEFVGNYSDLPIDTLSYGDIIIVPDVGVESGTDRIELVNGSFKLDYKNIPDTSNIFDVNHMYFRDLNLLAENADYLQEEMHADILEMSGNVKNNTLELKSFTTHAKIKNTGMWFHNLQMQSAHSFIKGNVSINYNKFNDIISDSITFNSIETQLDSVKLAMSEINYFYNTDSIFDLTNVKNKVINISASIKGNPNYLNIEKLNLKLFDNSQLITAGNIKYLNYFDSLSYFFDIKALKLSKDEFSAVVSDSLPDYLSFLFARGSVSGNAKSIESDINILSDLGEIDANISLVDSSYNLKARLINQNFTKVLNDTIKFEKIYGLIDIEGVGFDYKTSQINAKIQLDSANYNNERINDFFFKLTAENGTYNSKITSQNKKINLNSDIIFNLKDSVYKLVAKTNIKELDLQWLGFSKEKAVIKFDMDADYVGKYLDSLSADISINNLIFDYDKIYILDNLSSKIKIYDTLTDITVTSDYFSGFVKSNFNVRYTEERFLSFIDDYFFRKDSIQKYNSNISFLFDIHDEKIIENNLFGDLHSLSTNTIKGDFNSESYTLNLDAQINEFNYNDIIGDSVIFDIETEDNIINYDIDLGKINLTDSFYVEDLKLLGALDRDSLTFEFIDTEKNYKKYYFGASMVRVDTIVRLVINPEIILDSLLFDVNNGNYIDFNKTYLKFGAVLVKNKDQEIKIEPSVNNGDLDLSVKDFDIGLFMKNNFVQDDILGGLLNVNAILDINGNGSILVEIPELKVKNEEIGSFKLNTFIENWEFSLLSSLKGKDVDIEVKGDNKIRYELAVDLNKLDITVIKPFTSDIFNDLSGNLSGKFQLKEYESLIFNGNVKFNNVQFRSKLRNANLLIDNQNLIFSNDLITFNNFSILDSAGNKFNLNGKIYDVDYNYYKADLRLITNNFTFFDVKQEANKRFFGKVIIESDSRIVGDIDKLEIKSEVKFIEGTKITYVFPESELMSLENTNGVVEFLEEPNDSTFVIDTVVDNWYSNLILKSRVIVDNKTEINIIFNDVAGESIYLVGGADLNFDIDEGGSLNLNGTYEIENGYYNLSYYEIVKRKFNLKKGSKILWAGDPYNPIADITAMYKIKTNPYPLMVTSGATDAETAKYKRNEIFFVNLSIKGMMLYPEMNFTIDYPKIMENTNDQALHSKLNMINSDPAKANKQAVSLLLISSFITDDGNFVNGGETFVNNSVSSILTTQLNKYSSKFVKGVDFDFDVNRHSGYGTQGETADSQTDVKVKVKKKLFNERVTVEVAGGVTMESEHSSSGSTNIHDAAIEYLITKDGRYKLRVFSEKDYATMNQDVQSSGVSFIYTTEFDYYKDFFKKNSTTKKKNKKSND